MCMNIFIAYMLCALGACSALGGHPPLPPGCCYRWLIGYMFSGSVYLTTEAPAYFLNSRCVMAERQHGTKWIVKQ